MLITILTLSIGYISLYFEITFLYLQHIFIILVVIFSRSIMGKQKCSTVHCILNKRNIIGGIMVLFDLLFSVKKISVYVCIIKI